MPTKNLFVEDLCAVPDLVAGALMDFLRDKVAPYKRVRQVEVVDAIPRSPAGKILRRLLVHKNQK